MLVRVTVPGVKVWRALAVTLAAMLSVLGGGLLIHAGVVEWGGEPQFGNVAEWIAAVGTVAAFGALFLAVREWLAGQAERRDEEANQARLIIVEPAVEGSYSGELVVRNRSGSPVFNVFFQIGETARRMTAAKADWVTPGEMYIGIGSEGIEVLIPGAEFGPLRVDRALKPTNPKMVPVITARGDTPFPRSVVFTFTDVRGRQWKRVGGDQPVRVVES